MGAVLGESEIDRSAAVGKRRAGAIPTTAGPIEVRNDAFGTSGIWPISLEGF